MMPYPVPQDCEKDVYRVFPLLCEIIPGDVFFANLLLSQKALCLHLLKAPGQYSWRHSRIVPQYLAEPVQLQECNVSDDQERPLFPENLETLPDWIALVSQLRR